MHTMRRFLGVLLLGALALPVLADEVADVEAKIIEAAGQVKSLRAKTHTTMDMENPQMQVKMESKGTYEMVRKDGKMLLRSEQRTQSRHKIADQESKTDATSLMICDGDHAYTLTEQEGSKTAMKTKMSTEQVATANKAYFTDLHAKNEVKKLPDEKIGGNEVYVLEATSKLPESGKTVMYYCKKTGTPLKIVMLTPEGKPYQTTEMTDVEANIDLPAERFKFTAPEGVTVQEIGPQ